MDVEAVMAFLASLSCQQRCNFEAEVNYHVRLRWGPDALRGLPRPVACVQALLWCPDYVYGWYDPSLYQAVRGVYPRAWVPDGHFLRQMLGLADCTPIGRTA